MRYKNTDAVPIKEEGATKMANELKQGLWLLWKPRRINRNATYKCSHCGKLCSSYYNDVGTWKWCPHCGASMTKEQESKR